MEDTQNVGRKHGRHWKIISSYVDITRFELFAFCLVPNVLRIILKNFFADDYIALGL